MALNLQMVCNKTIWLIGASSGIGMALAHELAHAGAKVILSARRVDKLNIIKNALPHNNHHVEYIDVADKNSVAQAYNNITDKGIVIDSMVFLSACYSADDDERQSLDFIEQSINVNFKSLFYVLHAILPSFKADKAGQIIICSSVAGFRGLPYGQPYCATKAALLNMAESLKIELSDDNIDVKLITPGFVKTPLTDKNSFAMPMLITADKAAKHIVKGMCSRKFNIHFPITFTLVMKCISLLPYPWYFALMRYIGKQYKAS